MDKIYPEREQRKRLYFTSLPPRSGNRLIELSSEIRRYFEVGIEYARWDRYQRFDYVRDVAEQIARIPKFDSVIGTYKGEQWFEILHWWLDPGWGRDPDGLFVIPGWDPKEPTPESAPDWYKYVSDNFIYKLNWGIGSFISFTLSETYGDNASDYSIENWPLTGLPWVVFWLKELITWGTLDPVAAYVLARGRSRQITTRSHAESVARRYYDAQLKDIDSDELLNAESIRKWAELELSVPGQRTTTQPPKRIDATLLRDFSAAREPDFRVLPAQNDEGILWFDPAGFLLAKSDHRDDWQSDWLNSTDFFLDYLNRQVTSRRYL